MRTMRAVRGALGSCALMAAALLALALSATEAHALFMDSATGESIYGVKPFPVSLEVETNGAKARSVTVDRDQLEVTVTYSDGSTRLLANDDYELEAGVAPAGSEEEFSDVAIYEEAGHVVSGDFTLGPAGAYGAQYGDVLVFSRGVPPDERDGASLANVTWDIEDQEVTPLWDKSTVVTVVDDKTVKPVSIGGWFSQSSSIQTIALEQMDASALTSLVGAFKGASALKSVDMTGWDTSAVTSLGDLFYECRSLTSIAGLSDLDTSNVTSMRATFCNCTSLVSIDVSKWDTSKVTNMNHMFAMAWNTNVLASVGDLSGWNTSQVQDFACMFQGDQHVNGIGNVGRWNTSSANNIGCIFQSCESLSYVGDLAGWDVSHVTNMYNSFQGCKALTSIGNVSGWNTANVTTMFQMFQWDADLTVDCSSWNVAKVTSHDNFAGGNSKIKQPKW